MTTRINAPLHPDALIPVYIQEVDLAGKPKSGGLTRTDRRLRVELDFGSSDEDDEDANMLCYGAGVIPEGCRMANKHGCREIEGDYCHVFYYWSPEDSPLAVEAAKQKRRDLIGRWGSNETWREYCGYLWPAWTATERSSFEAEAARERAAERARVREEEAAQAAQRLAAEEARRPKTLGQWVRYILCDWSI